MELSVELNDIWLDGDRVATSLPTCNNDVVYLAVAFPATFLSLFPVLLGKLSYYAGCLNEVRNFPVQIPVQVVQCPSPISTCTIIVGSSRFGF